MEDTFEVMLTREGAYRFRVDFGDGHGATLEMDEPEPLGEGSGPTASRVLAAAVGNCLSASLLFCLSKARIEVAEMKTKVTGSVVRNEQGRLRVGPLKVHVEPGLHDAPPRTDRAMPRHLRGLLHRDGECALGAGRRCGRRRLDRRG
jgi:uncharacterized OsmC-like protein